MDLRSFPNIMESALPNRKDLKDVSVQIHSRKKKKNTTVV